MPLEASITAGFRPAPEPNLPNSRHGWSYPQIAERLTKLRPHPQILANEANKQVSTDLPSPWAESRPGHVATSRASPRSVDLGTPAGIASTADQPIHSAEQRLLGRAPRGRLSGSARAGHPRPYCGPGLVCGSSCKSSCRQHQNHPRRNRRIRAGLQFVVGRRASLARPTRGSCLPGRCRLSATLFSDAVPALFPKNRERLPVSAAAH